MHEVVAAFVCKLLDARAFSHIQDQMSSTEAKDASGQWVKGEKATKEIVDWCEDQWRRKTPRLPKALHENSNPYSATKKQQPQSYIVPMFGSGMPVCHKGLAYSLYGHSELEIELFYINYKAQ